MKTLLNDVVTEYQQGRLEENEHFLDQLYAVAAIRHTATAFLREMIAEWWKVPSNERATVGDVVEASGLSRQRLYQLKKEFGV